MLCSKIRHWRLTARVALSCAAIPVSAQERADRTDLDSLVAVALSTHPRIEAARYRVDAANARIVAAGVRPDPVFTVGIQNLPISEPGFGDFMTMKMLGLSQEFPAPGKLAAVQRAARHEAAAAEWRLVATQQDIRRSVRTAYNELAGTEALLDIVSSTKEVLLATAHAAEVRYTAGSAKQEEVIGIRSELTRLAAEAAELEERRTAWHAQLAALLSNGNTTLLRSPTFSAAIVRAAVADSPARVRFRTSTFGSRAADSPLPPVDSLQRWAERNNPELRAHEAMIAAQEAQTALAHLAARPNIGVNVQYGQRRGFGDMITAMVSVPLPIRRTQNQDQLQLAAGAERDAQMREHHDRIAQINATLASLVARAEQARTQIALTVVALRPQTGAVLEASRVSYQAGRTDFSKLMDAQAARFAVETAYVRSLVQFANLITEIEYVVGTEVLR